jgi:hypothetical protein
MGEALDDVTARTLREKAMKARELARYVAGDQRTTDNLESYAKELEEEALRLEEAAVLALSTTQRTA